MHGAVSPVKKEKRRRKTLASKGFTAARTALGGAARRAGRKQGTYLMPKPLLGNLSSRSHLADDHSVANSGLVKYQVNRGFSKQACNAVPLPGHHLRRSVGREGESGKKDALNGNLQAGKYVASGHYPDTGVHYRNKREAKHQ